MTTLFILVVTFTQCAIIILTIILKYNDNNIKDLQQKVKRVEYLVDYNFDQALQQQEEI